MISKDGRAVAQENEVRVLRALHRFGWLRTRDLAALTWQRWARYPAEAPCLEPLVPTASWLRMAQRTLRRLHDKRQVLSSRAPDGSLIYALAEAGARLLQQIGVAAATGKDQLRTFSSAHFRHRCIANEIAIGAIVGGFRVATEREVAQGLWLGGERGVAGKKPDVLIRGDGRVWWVEVERSRKTANDYSRLLKWLSAVLKDRLHPGSLLGDRLTWGKIVFICTGAFAKKLQRDLIQSCWTQAQINSLISLQTDLYRFEDITFG